jgi:hypothetical protein
MPFRAACGDFTDNREITLDQLLADPLVRLRMACDRVDENVLRQLAAEIRERSLQADLTRARRCQAEPRPA